MEKVTTKKSADWISSRLSTPEPPRILLILGSGWGPVVEDLMVIEKSIAYSDIPGFPVSTVEGHHGTLLLARMGDVPLYVMQGRFHYYEGYSMQEITFPIRVFAHLGVRGVFLTNAAGGIDPAFRPGQLMAIEDHINFMGDHPLRGPNDNASGPRFPDMTAAWDPRLRNILMETASAEGIPLHSGVYLAVSGPSFETPAEVRAFSGMGANAVGMSTVPECIVARHCGLRVTGLSCITNLAAHLGGAPLTHEEVAESARDSHAHVIGLLRGSIPSMHAQLGE
ncbi:purine-nucleoside phosphorylase [Puniceicoccales bacterium CK1056]|uniref:Purine nucleoside phosphorylase n=1 Tax=Oceanipulchritudo coccoides TaxID=2706888 RepID=A0A6B2LXC1_9BACT|nr:purine-nucleoside phosphorylase [Oceanipulchritudo coccoides]NDV60873.1 purine-nucleoside phosphorylase [Oceanipulchritudo coccoides]